MNWSGTSIINAGALVGIVALAACSGDSPTAIGGQEGNEQASSAVPSVFAWFSDDVETYVEGDYIVLRSNGVPNHPSPYFDTSDSRYAEYSGDNPDYQVNPNRILEQQLTFREVEQLIEDVRTLRG